MKMKKVLLLAMGFCIGISLVAIANPVDKMERVLFPVLLNGNNLQFDNPVVTINDRAYVPLRELADNLGMNVVWNEEKQQVELGVEAQSYDFGGRGERPDNAIKVSMINLIAHPERYHDKYVSVIGVWNIEFEGCVLYLSKDDWYYYNARNGIELSIDNDVWADREKAMLLNGACAKTLQNSPKYAIIYLSNKRGD